MQNLFKVAILPMMVSGGALLWGAGAPVIAATFVNLGNAAGVQCATAGVNDSGQSVGNCSQDDPSANGEPWYAASTAGPQQILPLLVANQPCAVGAIANNGSLLGSCADATGRNFAVTWSAATPSGAPTKLTPLPATFLIPLLRPADVQTAATAQNQQGAVLGLSISGAGAATVVLYMPGIATPLRISGWGDMCRGAVVNNTAINGYPSLLLNCPVNGKPVARVVTRGASGYSITDLPLASGASACWGVGMNDLNQIVGTCTFPTTPHQSSKAAFWPSPASAPRLLTLPLGANNTGVAVNNAGHVLARGMAPTGFTTDFFWADTTSSFGVRPIAFLPGSVGTQAFSLAENDTVAMDCTNSNEYPTACTWDPINATVPIPPVSGGLQSTLSSISFSGTYVAGVASDGAQDDLAVVAPLP
ncbi:hypothetical protein NHF41_07635 [Pseudomonas proteolytica]|nr:hypothetical protein [Pseudomonas proteolytica]USX01694.1 hypothetical protein NHF41_07635 [Pseudomonas proteolytica]